MRFAVPALLGSAALAAAQGLTFGGEALWPTSNNWTVSSIFASTNATTASLGFHLVMDLPFNNSLPALHQWCGRSWARGRSLVVPWDWATCEFDRKVAWRFKEGVAQEFPGNVTLDVVFWDAEGPYGETLVPKKAILPFDSQAEPSRDHVTGTCNEDNSRCEYNELSPNATAPIQLKVEVIGEHGPMGIISNVTSKTPVAPISQDQTTECGLSWTLSDVPSSNSDPVKAEHCELLFNCTLHPNVTTFGTICNSRATFLEVQNDAEYPTSPIKTYTLYSYDSATAFVDLQDREDNLTSVLRGEAKFDALLDWEVRCNGQTCSWPGVEKSMVVYGPEWTKATLHTIEPSTW